MISFLRLLILASLLASATAGATAASQLQTSVKSKADDTDWNVEFGYSGNTDLLAPGERSLSHSFELSPSVSFGKRWGLGAFVEFETESVNNEVIREEGSPGMGDSGLALSLPVEIGPLMTLQNSLVGVLPTSQISRDEGYRGIITAKSTLPMPFPKAHMLFVNSVRGSYIINTYEDSPTKLTANPQSSFGYDLSAIYKFNKTYFTGLGGEIRSTHYLDGVNLFRASNQVFVGAKWNPFSTRLVYTNGVVPDAVRNNALDSLQAVQLDEYRQVVAWEISCSF